MRNEKESNRRITFDSLRIARETGCPLNAYPEQEEKPRAS